MIKNCIHEPNVIKKNIQSEKHSSPSFSKIGPHLCEPFDDNPILRTFFRGFDTKLRKSVRIKEINQIVRVTSSYTKYKKDIECSCSHN